MIKKLQSELREFVNDRDWGQYHTLKNLSMALSVEAAELMDLCLWDRDPDLRKVRAEAADIFIYLLRIADVAQIDLLSVTRLKMRGNEKKYPVSQARGNCKKYKEFAK